MLRTTQDLDFHQVGFILVATLALGLALSSVVRTGFTVESEPLNEKSTVLEYYEQVPDTNNRIKDAEVIVRIHEQYENDLDEFEKSTKERVEKVDQLYRREMTEFNRTVEEQLDDIEKNMATKEDIRSAEEIWSTVQGQAVEVMRSKIEEKFSELRNEVDTQSKSFEEDLDRFVSESISLDRSESEAYIRSLQANITGRIEERIKQISDSLNTEITRKFTDSKENMTTVIAEEIQSTISELHTSDSFHAVVSEVVDKRSAEFQATQSSLEQRVNKYVEEAAAKIATAENQSRREIEEIDSKVRQLTESSESKPVLASDTNLDSRIHGALGRRLEEIISVYVIPNEQSTPYVGTKGSQSIVDEHLADKYKPECRPGQEPGPHCRRTEGVQIEQ